MRYMENKEIYWFIYFLQKVVVFRVPQPKRSESTKAMFLESQSFALLSTQANVEHKKYKLWTDIIFVGFFGPFCGGKSKLGSKSLRQS